MVGLDSLCGVWEIKTVKGRPREDEARELLQKIADQVKPICMAHKWNVRLLEEFIPPNPSLLGMNVNRQKILIRLRPPSNAGAFYPYEDLLHTMLHELTHMEIGPHNASFYKMLDELRDECEKLMREGITGRNMPFAGHGKPLGGGRPPVDARNAALKAAERRQRQQAVMGGGTRLGGSLDGSRSAAERAAAAAEWRHAVSRGCAATQDGTSSQVDGGCSSHGGDPDRHEDGAGGSEWDCGLCTLHNGSAMGACDACGTPRPASAAGASTAAAASLARARERGGGSGDVRNVYSGEERAEEVGLAKASAMARGRTKRSDRSGAGSAPTAATVGRRRNGLPIQSTWTCRECPFAFPNAAERRTCESCGAPRGKGSCADGRGLQGARPELSPWACGLCTFVNPGVFLSCRICQALRDAEGAAERNSRERQDGAAGSLVDAPVGGETWNHPPGGADAAHVFPENVGGSSSTVGEVCSMCTLRNTAEASTCAACGIPLAESAAAMSAPSEGSAPLGVVGVRGRRSRRGNEGPGSRQGDNDVTSDNAPDLIDLC